MNKIYKEEGISHISLIIIICIILVISGVIIVNGFIWLRRHSVENYTTNMITIKARTKVMLEEVNKKLWEISNEEKQNKRNEYLVGEDYRLTKIELLEEYKSQIDSEITNDNYECYEIDKEGLIKIGAENVKPEKYIIIFKSDDYNKIEILYKKGVKYKGKILYSLSEMQKELE